jgi:hypothetical protein
MTDLSSIELRPHQQQDSSKRKQSGPFVKVNLSQKNANLEITFSIQDPDNLVLWPDEVSSPMRKDNLWQQTCFELFIANREREKPEAYQEWNFSSNGNWQAYTFKNYRSPSPPQELMKTAQPEIVWKESKLIVRLKDIFLSKDTDYLINPTAMIQLKDKTLIAYANKHPEKGPDFHSQECFFPWPGFSRKGDR